MPGFPDVTIPLTTPPVWTPPPIGCWWPPLPDLLTFPDMPPFPLDWPPLDEPWTTPPQDPYKPLTPAPKWPPDDLKPFTPPDTTPLPPIAWPPKPHPWPPVSPPAPTWPPTPPGTPTAPTLPAANMMAFCERVMALWDAVRAHRATMANTDTPRWIDLVAQRDVVTPTLVQMVLAYIAMLWNTHLDDVAAPVTTSDAEATYEDTATITLTATDPGYPSTGVAHTYYVLDGGATAEYTEPIVVDAVAAHTLSFWSVDVAGNVEAENTVEFEVTSADGQIFTLSVDWSGNIAAGASAVCATSDLYTDGTQDYYRIHGVFTMTGDTAGLDPHSIFYLQVSLDDGATWPYYFDFTSHVDFAVTFDAEARGHHGTQARVRLGALNTDYPWPPGLSRDLAVTGTLYGDPL